MTDITIKGAGIFGLSIAWECLRRGATVQVIDPHGVGAGSSGGVVGALAPHVPENWNPKKDFQFESLIASKGFWAAVDAAGGGASGYAQTGRLQPIEDDKTLELAHQRAETAQTLWQGKAVWEVVSHSADWPVTSPTGYWIYDTLSARINPKQACAALAAAIIGKGGRIVSDGPERGAVVWAAGVWDLHRISNALGKTFGNGVKGQAAVFDFDLAHAPQLFAQTLHFIPHANGTIAVGSTSERDYSEPASTDDQLDDVIARAKRIVPALEQAPIIARWAGVRPRSKSRAPVLGRHPLNPEHFIANGGFKIGFGMAPKIAQVMADYVLEGKNAIPEDFTPEKSL